MPALQKLDIINPVQVQKWSFTPEKTTAFELGLVRGVFGILWDRHPACPS